MSNTSKQITKGDPTLYVKKELEWSWVSALHDVNFELNQIFICDFR